MTRISAAGSQSNLLSREEFHSSENLTPTQIEIDGLQATFMHEASDTGNILAMTTAAGVFRMARYGMQSLGLARAIANPLALTVETTAFRGMTNLVSHARGQVPAENILDGKGWFTSFLTLGSLKAAGAAVRGQSMLLGHTVQASAMVASHNLAYSLNLATQPQGNLVKQFLQAEVSNLALGAGDSLFRLGTGGGISRAEQRLDSIAEVQGRRLQIQSASQRLAQTRMASVADTAVEAPNHPYVRNARVERLLGAEVVSASPEGGVRPIATAILIAGANGDTSCFTDLPNRLLAQGIAVKMITIPGYERDAEYSLSGGGRQTSRNVKHWERHLDAVVERVVAETQGDIYLGGLSTGGTEAVRVYERMSDHLRSKIAGLPLAAPSFSFTGIETLHPAAAWFGRHVKINAQAFLGLSRNRTQVAFAPTAHNQQVRVITQRSWAGELAAIRWAERGRESLQRIERMADKVPVLLLHSGDKDPTVHSSSGEFVKRAFGNKVQEVLLPEAGHWLFAGPENARASDAVVDFIVRTQEARRLQVPEDFPVDEFSPAWARVEGGPNLYTPRTDASIRTNRELLNAIIQRGVFGMLGKKFVRVIMGYGSGFEGIDYDASARARDIDNKFDLVVVVSSFRESFEVLGDLWGDTAQVRAERLAIAEKGGVFCPNPDMLVSGFGLTGFKLTIVEEASGYFASSQKGLTTDFTHSVAGLTFAQFRTKDAVIRDASDSANRLLYRDPSISVERIQNNLEKVRDRMLDFAYRLKASPLIGFLKPRFWSDHFGTEDLGRWFYQFSYDIELYRAHEWVKGNKLFNKRQKDFAPVFLPAIQRFAQRHQLELAVFHGEREITPEQITRENFYEIQFRDRSVATYFSERGQAIRAVFQLFGMLKASWAASYAAIKTGKYSRSYEPYDNSGYGGRKARGWMYDGERIKWGVWALARLVQGVTLGRLVDTIYFPVGFTRIAMQMNDLYRAHRINDREWEMLNRAWMADPALRRLKNVRALELFDAQIPQDAKSQQTYAKFLDSLIHMHHVNREVLAWARERRVGIATEPVSTTQAIFNDVLGRQVMELDSWEQLAVAPWILVYRVQEPEQVVAKMIEGLREQVPHLNYGLAKLLLKIRQSEGLDPSIAAQIDAHRDEIDFFTQARQ